MSKEKIKTARKKKSPVRRILKVLLVLILTVVAVAVLYLGYVFISYHRLGNMELTPVDGRAADKIPTGENLTILSYNIGFGAYESDYGFFMDGGTQSWAWSKDRLDKNLNNIAGFAAGQDADIDIFQEVDFNSTRTYHVDEREYLIAALPGQSYTFAQNYDSPFLMYPLTQPHGASKSGLLTFSKYKINAASRVELPIETGLTKFLDLDRCYSKNRIAADDGNELIVYNFHLSAYTSDGKIANEQLKLLLDDMDAEFAKGNYCIAGGDFNKDLLGDSSKYFKVPNDGYTWAQPIPEETFDGHHVTLVAPLDEDDPVPSCRNSDGPYVKGVQFVITVDGFLVTDNVTVNSSEVVDLEFAYSDHNPVRMEVVLGK